MNDCELKVEDVVDYTLSPQSVELKGIPFHTTPSHDHSCTSLNLNSSGTMFSKDNQTLCGSATILQWLCQALIFRMFT